MSDTEHELIFVGRTSRGKNFRGATEYATVGRCSCGQRFQVNEAPSKGGRKTLAHLFERHCEPVVEIPL